MGVSQDLAAVVRAFQGRRVGVIGEAMLDSYVEGNSSRLSPEAPVPVVNVSRRRDVPGGAANTAVNLQALCAAVRFVSIVGQDAAGMALSSALAARGIDTSGMLACAGRSTLVKHRVTAGGHLLLRFDEGCEEPLDADVEAALVDRLRCLHAESEALIVSDYGRGLMTSRVIRALSGLQEGDRKLLLVDAKQLDRYVDVPAVVAKPNYAEACRALSLPELAGDAARLDQMRSHGPELMQRMRADLLAITLDSAGALFIERTGASYRTYARPVQNPQPAGAGDTFLAALTLALICGAAVPAAAELASAAAAVVVAKPGTACCLAAELCRQIAPSEKCVSGEEQLRARIDSQRAAGASVVFTNGCFDVLHRGHVAFLNRARALGDVLVVGLNSDASVARLKGPGRPINGLDDRVQLLAALSAVDVIATFEDDRPDDLIRLIRPEVVAKGGNYTREQLPEAGLVAELGGRVEIVPLLPDHSTSGLIRRIRDVAPADSSQPEHGSSLVGGATAALR